MSAYYKIAWSSVDGAGSSDEKILDQQEAIRKADAAQRSCEEDGNAWGYTYRVKRAYTDFWRTDSIYNARTKEKL